MRVSRPALSAVGPLAGSPGDGALTQDEAARRPLSAGFLLAVVLGTVSVVGAAFTFGTRWGGADASTQASVGALAQRAGTLEDLVRGLADRVRVVEDVRSGLTPAVANLSAQTSKLAEVVAGVRENMAAQTAELRSLKEAVDNLRSRVDNLTAHPPR